MRNSFNDVEFVADAVRKTLDVVPDTVNVLSVFLAIQVVLKSYIETMAELGIVLPSEVVTLQSHLDYCVHESTGALVELDHEYNRKN